MENDYKAMYEQEHSDFEAYKNQIAETERKKTAFRRLLREVPISEKRVDAVMKLTDFSEMQLDENGELVNSDLIRASVKNEWSEYVVKVWDRGEDVAHPPRQDYSSDNRAYIRQLAKKWHEERYGKKKAED